MLGVPAGILTAALLIFPKSADAPALTHQKEEDDVVVGDIEFLLQQEEPEESSNQKPKSAPFQGRIMQNGRFDFSCLKHD